MFLHKMRLIAALAVCAVAMAGTAQAVTVKIKKTYADGITENPPGSKIVEVNSPLYISDAFDQYGYATNLVDGMSEIIFEDSETYVLADDKAAGKPTKDPGPITLGFGNNIDPGFGGVGAGGFYMKAAPGESPTIDISNLTADSWGANTFMHVYQTKNGQKCKFKGLNFVNTSNYGGDGSGYTEALIRWGGSGGDIPTFEDCTFDIDFPVVSYGSWDGASPNKGANGIEFKHCAFRMTESYGGAYSRRNIAIAHSQPTVINGVLELENCTFIGNGQAAADNWSVFWGDANEPPYSFVRCVFYNMGYGVRYRTIDTFQDNIVFPGLDGPGDPVTNGTNIIVEDPLFIDVENSFSLAVGSPADNGGGYANIGYDLLLPVELSDFAAE